MKFSVLLSVYKNERSEFFRKALDSILDQTLKPNEIVIIKDGLLTCELEMVCLEYKKKYADLFKFIQLQNNQGLGKALQVGVKCCTYDLIARMDTDDIAKPERFEKQMREFENNIDLAILGGAIEEFSISPECVESVRRVPLYNEDIYRYAKKRNPFYHMTVMFRKNIVLNVGNYQPFYLNEDYFLWMRVLKNGYKVKNLPDSLVSVRANEEMFKRRGGLKYLKQELKLQNLFYKHRFINEFEYFRNMGIRIVARIIPNQMRMIIYRKCLRKRT